MKLKRIMDTHYFGTMKFCQNYVSGYRKIPEVMAAFLISIFLTFNLVVISLAVKWEFHIVGFQIFFFVTSLLMWMMYLKKEDYKRLNINLSFLSKVIIILYYILSILTPILIGIINTA
jgi:bacteriorhodopsin